MDGAAVSIRPTVQLMPHPRTSYLATAAIFLEVLARHGNTGLDGVIADIAAAPTPEAVIACLVRWADERSRSGNWSLTRCVGSHGPAQRRD